jgi:hypothetical protein
MASPSVDYRWKVEENICEFRLMPFARKGRIPVGSHLLASAIRDGIRDPQVFGNLDSTFTVGFQESHRFLLELRRKDAL